MTIRLEKPLVYVTRDIERALGMEPKDNYYIISNDTPHGRELQKKYPENIWLLESKKMADTYELLQLPGIDDVIAKYGAGVVVFQNDPRVERLAQEKKWNLLNPPASLSREVEEKVSQVKWLGSDVELLPPHKVTIVQEVTYTGSKFVLQFNHSHTGEGTFVIDSDAKLDELKAKFPKRECRVVDFVEGPVFTLNAAITYDVILGNLSYQITGLPPFTDLPFSTVGNDWSLPREEKYKQCVEDAKAIATRVGKKLQASGWRGLYGIDVVWSERTQKTFLLEINARQPASAAYESQLQKALEPEGTSIFEAHISALLRLPIKDYIKAPISGSQIVQRVTRTRRSVKAKALQAKGLTVIKYKNEDHNKDLFRIQSETGIMAEPGVFNKTGEFISSCIK